MPAFGNHTDDELVARLREGNAAAYTEIYNRYERLLYLFVFRRLGDREEVKDIVHEVFLSLWQNREKVNIAYTLNTYLHSAARNKIIDVIARKQLSSRYIESFNYYKASEQSTTDHLIRHKQLVEMIDREIEALPPKMRRVFELSRKTNLNRKQIAEKLDLSEQTVKSHMHHALSILRAKLGSLFFLVFL